MIPHQQALDRILEHVSPMPREFLPLSEAAGRALAADFRAPFGLPRFDQSAMDGVAVRMDDMAAGGAHRPVVLELIGQMPAGTPQHLILRPGQTVQVYTGGPLPVGTQAVVMIENCRVKANRVTIRAAVKPGDHIRSRGEELQRGKMLLPAGTRLTPPVIGLLASFGVSRLGVHRLPRVALITMGDELVAPDTRLGPGQIHDANGPALLAALATMGIGNVRHDTVMDDPKALQAAMRRADVLITVGGASVGDHDHTAAARQALGITEIFDRVAIKPGKPNIFGLYRNRIPVFGLPGNPVSALVSFAQLVKPALRAMAGLPQDEAPIRTALLSETCLKNPGRAEWVRGKLSERDGVLTVRPHPARGSHMLTGLTESDVLLELPLEAEVVAKGSRVRIHPLDWSR